MILWDNSNIIESYPGVTTPLTFSFIIKMYESVYIQLCRLLGVSETDLIENRTVFENMLGLINGRVYYNLLSWYKALALLPGYQLNAEFMEKMMGVKERFELKNIPQRTKWTERFRVLIMIRSMWKNLRELPSMRRDFQREFQIVLDEFDAIDFSKKSAWELMELYLKFELTLLKKWKAPLVNDFYAMIYFGVLQKLVDKYELPSGIHNDLLSGADDIISTEPIKRMQEMRLAVLEIEELKKLFEDDSNTAESLWTAINKDYLGVQQLIHKYYH
jgi:pyruvate,water dikinase